MGLVVVKVGGSLFDLPDLGPRLATWLQRRGERQVLLLPGGGPTTDVIRSFDKRFGLGEEKAHWLALRALTLNAHVLADLLPAASVVARLAECGPLWEQKRIPILDALAFLRTDSADTLPHRWQASSDSVAACVAVAAEARRLVLLKSASAATASNVETVPWGGLVDGCFEEVLRASCSPIEVEVVNLREVSDQDR
jgi:aspartokinase-like uncharacterized kinase